MGTARLLLQHCLMLLAHLQQDWDAEEYGRTVGVARLTWTPWHSQVPKPCFVEVACEFSLARAVGRLRAHQSRMSCEDSQDLFLTLP